MKRTQANRVVKHQPISCTNMGLVKLTTAKEYKLPMYKFHPIIIDDEVYYVIWYEYFNHNCIIVRNRANDPSVWFETTMDVVTFHN